MTTIEQVAANEAKKIEAKVEAVAGEVKSEVVKVAEEVKAAVIKVVDKAAHDNTTLQVISDAEKLSIREIENVYLKAQIQINTLSQTTQKAQADFTKTVEVLAKKYALDPAIWAFDNVELIWKKMK